MIHKAPIIHVSGSQGTGKSTMGHALLKKYGDKVQVIDLDDLQSSTIDLQTAINMKIEENQNIPIVFVGLDAELCKGDMEHSDVVYDLHADHKFYISSSETTLKQRFFRQIKKLSDRKDWFFDHWLKNPDDAQKKLFRFINLTKWKINNEECDKLHLDRKYITMGSHDIFENVCEILDSYFPQIGGSHIQIILFGNVMSGSGQWFYDLEGNEINFVSKLAEIGNVVVLEPNYVNFMKYSLAEDKGGNWAHKPKNDEHYKTDFKVSDLYFENYAEWVFSQIDPTKRYIAISLDQGCHFAKYFCNTYSEMCIRLYVIGDRNLTEKSYNSAFRSEANIDVIKSVVGEHYEKYMIENLTDDTINELLAHIRETNDEKYIELLNGICKGIIRSQYAKITDLRVNATIYSDVATLSPDKLENSKILFDAGSLFYFVIMKHYYLIYDKQYCADILNNIKSIVFE